MVTVHNKKGSCLCGSVTFKASNVDTSVHVCHCSMCRKYGGGPSMSVTCGVDIEFSGDSIKIYESSEWAERGFCSNCGTHLFYRLTQDNVYMVCPGIFDDAIDFVFDEEIYIDNKPQFYDFANKTKKLTEEQVIERATAKK